MHRVDYTEIYARFDQQPEGLASLDKCEGKIEGRREPRDGGDIVVQIIPAIEYRLPGLDKIDIGFDFGFAARVLPGNLYQVSPVKL